MTRAKKRPLGVPTRPPMTRSRALPGQGRAGACSRCLVGLSRIA